MNTRQKIIKYISETRPLRWLNNQWESHPVRLIGWILAIGAVANFILAFVPCKLFETFSANFSAELGSIAITVLILERLNERRQEKLRLQLEAEQKKREQEILKAQLTRDLLSNVTDFAVRAVDELRHYGWLDEVLQVEKANLGQSHLEGALLREANLEGAFLSRASLKGANLFGANLKGAFLEFAKLERVNLYGANLGGAFLRRANLQGSVLRRANLQGVNLYGANLQGAKGTTTEQLLKAKNLDDAIMPDSSKFEEWILRLTEEGEVDKKVLEKVSRLLGEEEE